MCVSLFLGSVILIYTSFFFVSTTLWITVALWYCLKYGDVTSPALSFSLSIALEILGCCFFFWLLFHINFSIILVM